LRGRAAQGPSNPNSLDADVPAPRTAPVDAAVARGALAAAGEEARDAPAAPDDEALVVRCLRWAGRRCVDARACERVPAFVCVLARGTDCLTNAAEAPL
jgi:hypothetical protein